MTRKEGVVPEYMKQMEKLGLNVHEKFNQLVLPTPTGNIPLVVQKVTEGPQDTLVTRVDPDYWDWALDEDRVLFMVMHPGDPQLVLRDQFADTFWRTSKDRSNRWWRIFRMPQLPADRALTLADIPDDLDAQLSFDGSATTDPTRFRRIGNRQRDVLRHIAFWPSTSTELGTFIHQQIYGGELCGQYARDAKYDAPYQGHGCCAEASSTGSKIARSLVESLDIEGKRWRVRDEAWV